MDHNKTIERNHMNTKKNSLKNNVEDNVLVEWNVYAFKGHDVEDNISVERKTYSR